MILNNRGKSSLKSKGVKCPPWRVEAAQHLEELPRGVPWSGHPARGISKQSQTTVISREEDNEKSFPARHQLLSRAGTWQDTLPLLWLTALLEGGWESAPVPPALFLSWCPSCSSRTPQSSHLWPQCLILQKRMPTKSVNSLSFWVWTLVWLGRLVLSFFLLFLFLLLFLMLLFLLLFLVFLFTFWGTGAAPIFVWGWILQ